MELIKEAWLLLRSPIDMYRYGKELDKEIEEKGFEQVMKEMYEEEERMEKELLR
jgi:hypothetical protein